MYDLFEAMRRKTEAIEAVTANATAEFHDVARTAINDVSEAMTEFTADDVWQRIETVGIKGYSSDPRALGGVLLHMAKEGVIEPLNCYRPSARRHCSPIRVWRKKA